MAMTGGARLSRPVAQIAFALFSMLQKDMLEGQTGIGANEGCR